MPVELTSGMLPPGEATDKIMCLVSSFPGKGKSGFALSFPEPIWYFNLDRAIGHFHDAWATRKVTYEAVVIDVDKPSPAVANAYLAKFDLLVRDAIKSKTNGTFIIDGWDIFWDLVKYAKLPAGGADSMPKEWAEANEYMNNHLRRLGLSQLNAVFTTIASKVWTGMKTETDRVRADGFKHKDRWLTHEVYLFSPENNTEPEAVPKNAATPGQAHYARINQSKLNEKLIGVVVPSLTFSLLYKLTWGRPYSQPERLWSPAQAARATLSQPESPGE